MPTTPLKALATGIPDAIAKGLVTAGTATPETIADAIAKLSAEIAQAFGEHHGSPLPDVDVWDNAASPAQHNRPWADNSDPTDTGFGVDPDHMADAKGGGSAGRGKPIKDSGGTTTTDPTTTDPGTTDPGSTSGTDTGSTGGTSSGETNTGTTDPNKYVSGLDTPDGFNVELVFNGTWSAGARAAVEAAAELISDIVTGDIASYNGIDDIRIQCYAQSIDGSGGILAQGGWITLRPDAQKLVAEGGLRLDTADIDNQLSKGMLDDISFHEMLHAMGFGTTWAYTGMTAEIGGYTRFTGQNAIEAYNTYYASAAATDAYSDQGVPLSNDDGHWNQKLFGSEIMSPVLTSTEVLSPMTIAALEDMGYQTTYESGLVV